MNDRNCYVYLRHVYDHLNDYFCDRLARGDHTPPTWQDIDTALKGIDAADVRLVARDTPHIQDALDLVVEERRRQIEKWGDQSENHLFEWVSILGEEFGELCEAVNESCFQNATHRDRGGMQNVINEAVQVAAVAVSIVENVINRTGGLHHEQHEKPHQEEP